MLVKGVDPGAATGVAIYDLKTCKPVLMEETSGGVQGFVAHHGWATAHQFQPIEHFVCEAFTLRSSNKFTADLSGVEIIGWLKGQGYPYTYVQPSQHMTLTRLREKKDSYADSVITQMMRDAGFKIGKGHTRMGLSVAVWYAAKVLNHRPTLELLKPKDMK